MSVPAHEREHPANPPIVVSRASMRLYKDPGVITPEIITCYGLVWFPHDVPFCFKAHPSEIKRDNPWWVSILIHPLVFTSNHAADFMSYNAQHLALRLGSTKEDIQSALASGGLKEMVERQLIAKEPDYYAFLTSSDRDILKGTAKEEILRACFEHYGNLQRPI